MNLSTSVQIDLLQVAKHKTSAQGPALLVVEEDLYQMMVLYNQACKIDSSGETFFSNNSGQEIRPGQEMSRLWKSLGIRVGKTVNPTQFRKNVAVMSWKYNNTDSDRIRVADYMRHNVKTQRLYYDAQQRHRDAVAAKTLITKLKKKQSNQDSNAQQLDNVGVTVEAAQQMSKSNQDSNAQQLDNVGVTVEAAQQISKEHYFRTRYAFTNMDIALLRVIFKSVLKGRVTKAKVKALYDINEDIQHMTLKSVYDKVRNLKK
ncbi:uncharacterized protein LOC117103586 [Anneissia japonica]|uniref:uncharacterized protein LOC117103586 n=1 Tax=Anneissia japonica TaxID=1529436 RepID=UPI00142588C0|nr:uncharacterized protein LOC117103586 [Anneissia japonica]